MLNVSKDKSIRKRVGGGGGCSRVRVLVRTVYYIVIKMFFLKKKASIFQNFEGFVIYTTSLLVQDYRLETRILLTYIWNRTLLGLVLNLQGLKEGGFLILVACLKPFRPLKHMPNGIPSLSYPAGT